MDALEKGIVKSWFVSRAKPFATQFAQWIDACWFKGEKIPVTDIDGLSLYLSSYIISSNEPVILVLNADGVYTIPAGFAIHKIYIIAVEDSVITIGSLATADLYAGDIELLSDEPFAVGIDIMATVETAVKFYNITSATTFKIHLLKI